MIMIALLSKDLYPTVLFTSNAEPIPSDVQLSPEISMYQYNVNLSKQIPIVCQHVIGDVATMLG
jgi:hypothetical protein